MHFWTASSCVSTLESSPHNCALPKGAKINPCFPRLLEHGWYSVLPRRIGLGGGGDGAGRKDCMWNPCLPKRIWQKACVSGLFWQFQARSCRTLAGESSRNTIFVILLKYSREPGCWGKFCVIADIKGEREISELAQVLKFSSQGGK